MQAQEEVFIYSGNEKEYFETNTSVKYIKCWGKQNRNFECLSDIIQTADQVMPDVFKITLDNSNKDLFNRKMYEIDSIYVADELIYKGDGTRQCCFDHILLQTKGSVVLSEILKSYNIPYISFESFGLCENEYLLKLSVPQALYYANKLVETGYFVYAQPSFYRFDTFNNPLYPHQWGLKNTGQSNGTIGMDINVEPAWELSTGKGITVAVIDDGVQLNHPDLQGNLIMGYDAIENTNNGSYTGNDNHGTCCAGIIAAKDNNIGVKGIAYESKIIPIRIAFDNNWNDEYVIRAFIHAYNRCADIISCSWGGGSNSSMLTNTINSVVENGRNGLGTPVLFSSGNHNAKHPGTNVRYPANLSTTIAVGGINYCGERIVYGDNNYVNCDNNHGWGSCFGMELDVVAPAVKIPTTDIESNYTCSFNGTSAACPHAAGVMALMLSANPCLTQDEARRILSVTCEKINTYNFCDMNNDESWNPEVGYGLINAYKAVLYSLSANKYNIQINGDLVSTTDNVQIHVNDGLCSALGAGWYVCKQYEYSASIAFPNMHDPQIRVMANGLSAATDNNGNYFACVASSTDTSAVLKTWKYYVYSNTAGQANNVFIPTNDNIVFYATVFDIPKDSINLYNESISSGVFNRNAIRTIHVNNFNVAGSANVHISAGETVVFHNGTRIAPSTGYFCTQSGLQPMFCENYVQTRNNRLGRTDYTEKYRNIVNDDVVNIYPNPNNGSFYISFSDNEQDIINVRVIDAMGKTVYSNNRFADGEIVLPNSKSGMYCVSVTLKDKTITKKIIIK